MHVRRRRLSTCSTSFDLALVQPETLVDSKGPCPMAPVNLDTYLEGLSVALCTQGQHLNYEHLISVTSRMRTILRELDSRVNALAPVNRLHTEILSMIFMLICEEDRPNVIVSASPNVFVDASLLVRLTHVCRHWREVALANPALWKSFHFRCPEKSEAFLERSKGLLVSPYLNPGPIVMDPSHSDDYEWFANQQIRTVTSRLDCLPGPRLLRLDLNTLFSARTLTPLKNLRAPRLECLTIFSDWESYELSRSNAGIESVSLCDGHTDALKALAIAPVVNWLPSNHFPNLTHLYLSFHDTIRFYQVDIMKILEKTPQLQSLFMQMNATEPGDFLTVPRARPVALDQLRSLVIRECDFNNAIRMLELLVLPSHCLVRLCDIEAPLAYEDDQLESLPALTSFDRAIHMDLLVDVEDAIDLVVDDGESSGFWLQASVEDDGGDAWDLWVSQLLTSVSLANITSLHMNVHHEHVFWPVILQHVPQISEMSVVIGEMPDDELHATPSIRSFCELLSQKGPVLCPALRTLRMQSVGLHGLRQACTLSPDDLASMLAARAHSGRRIDRLDIQPGPFMQKEKFEELAPSYLGLRNHVDVFNLIPPGPELCAYEVREIWRQEDLERYWGVEKKDKPCYLDTGIW
ncbi:hypothetical protein C8Q74DRAFT_1336659 [Fomes fomentarius]|nr:hypothetical protein C8Q74DRAFT_1336659 [Fomes fomentarius]